MFKPKTAALETIGKKFPERIQLLEKLLTDTTRPHRLQNRPRNS